MFKNLVNVNAHDGVVMPCSTEYMFSRTVLHGLTSLRAIDLTLPRHSAQVMR
jgi:hypothetical protein